MIIVHFIIAVLVFFVGEVHSSHYRGGTISFRPKGSSPYSVDFTFRLSFRRGAVYCDSNRVANRSLASTSFSNTWKVKSYHGSIVSSSSGGRANIYCTNFNVEEDWSEGSNSFTYAGNYGGDWWNVRITDRGNWIHGITYSNPNDIMQLEARVNRTVSGTFNNSSPVSNISLTVYVVQGIPSVIKIPVEDPDGDIVRCRNASYQECYRGMCTYFPHGVLDEGDCTLSYNGNGNASQLFPIILKLEDFPSGTTQFDPSSSLGSVDLQFVVHVINGTECSNYTVLNSRNRSQEVFRGDVLLCDNHLDRAWYRFMGDAGTAMPTSCTPKDHCGTHASGWMNGSHPTQAEGIVTRRVCYHWDSSCCRWDNNIRVRNCGGFYLYELVRPPTCSLRYCGNGTGSNNTCASSPCRNDGTCAPTYSGYMCYCPYGYTGRQCETNSYSCSCNPCRNGGICRGGVGWYHCSCRNGYTGRQCETNLRTTVTCDENYMQFDLKDAYFSDIDWRNLHLTDPSCRATKTAHTKRLRAPLDRCGTTYTENQKTITFWNEVRTDNRYQPVVNGSIISRDRNLVLRFFCEYERSRFVSTSFSPSKKTVITSEGSYGNFTFTMDLYQTSSYSTPYSPFSYPVVVYPNQPLWVQYEVKNTNADLVVFAENCRATPSNDPNATPQHVFLQRGCVRDSTMNYWYNPYSKVQRFSIRSFRFVYSNTFLVYLHCELIVCHRNSNNSRCAQGCISGSRGRRETADMDGSKAYDLSAGPLKGGKIEPKSDNQESSLKSKQLIGGLGAVGGLFFLITILLSVIFYRNRKRGQDNKPTTITLDVTVNSYEQDNVDKDELEE